MSAAITPTAVLIPQSFAPGEAYQFLSPGAKSRFLDDSGTFGYDPANATLLGRGVSLQVVRRWGL